MKKIIDGLKYDTATGKEIHKWDNGLSRSDFRSTEETLFNTPKGRFFLHGWSGALGPYSEPVGTNSWGEGETILALSRREAFEWLTEHAGEDIAETEFSDLIEEA